ncbi:hypothetical protein GCM10027185_48670 [Spirosoma pulveris]
MVYSSGCRLNTKEQVTAKQILDIFKESAVMKALENKPEAEGNEILREILSQTNEEKQVRMILTILRS